MITLNDKVIAYLAVNNILYVIGQFTTGIPSGTETDQIVYWDTTALGPQPTKAHLDAAYQSWEKQQIAKQNKIKAEELLKESDWSQYPDVTNPLNTPHLINGDAWVTYRASVRTIALNPPVSVTEWPTKPEELWSTTV